MLDRRLRRFYTGKRNVNKSAMTKDDSLHSNGSMLIQKMETRRFNKDITVAEPLRQSLEEIATGGVQVSGED